MKIVFPFGVICTFVLIFLCSSNLVAYSDAGDLNNNQGASIQSFSVTAGEYRDFLNAVASSDPHELFDEQVGPESMSALIKRSGAPGYYRYSVTQENEDTPLTIYADAAMRYCNWKEHGQLTGVTALSTTEDGVYTMQDNDAVAVNPEANNYFPELLNSISNEEDSSGLPMMMASGPLAYTGILKLDDDGSGPSHGDPYHRNDTSLQVNGHYLNADTDSYVVAPAWLLQLGVKMGDTAYISTGWSAGWCHGYYYSSPHTVTVASIVGDTGPMQDSVGEISIEAARQLDFSFHEVNGIGPVPLNNLGQDGDFSITVTYYPSGG